jgi:hypothetical protein
MGSPTLRRPEFFAIARSALECGGGGTAMVVFRLLALGKQTPAAPQQVPTFRGSVEDAKDYHSDAGSSHSTNRG